MKPRVAPRAGRNNAAHGSNKAPTREHIGHIRPRSNAVRREASPLEYSGAFCHGLLVRLVREVASPTAAARCRVCSSLVWSVLEMTEIPKGLATVAFLKTRLDEGHDHVGMFEPLVHDALHGLTAQDFLADDIQLQVGNRSSIRLPRAAVSTLLRRLTRRGFLVRKGGRFFRTAKAIPKPDFDQAVERISVEQRALGAALVDYATDKGCDFGSAESALGSFWQRFVSDNKVQLVLDEAFRDSPLDRSSGSRKIVRLIARFVTERCLDPSEHQLAAFKTLIEGIVLYDTVLLTETSQGG